ncbi:hypothetical protein AVEN_133355-1 [Araneus ventricosus]|uniref:CCHC-type domain-containing protein n=1 Tax=Araneus ventricosus TaxID=182803 RepID=A0A4Y2DJZ3_ARAVE|nr:hypothetical protein AVEN_133355-1 [Araneus ventricosus]
MNAPYYPFPSSYASGFSPNAPMTYIQSTVKLPTMKIEPFDGDIEKFHILFEQFSSAVDLNQRLPAIDKHVYLRGYLKDEPTRLVDGISITAETYETVKNILKIECNRRLQALTALGEDINTYGRILTPKILRAFPNDVCQRWIIQAKREKISESDISKLREFLSEEVEGALTTLKIKGEQTDEFCALPCKAAFNVNSKTQYKPKNYSKKPTPFCPFCNVAGHWPQDCKSVTDIDVRVQKLKTAGRCYLCTNKGHNVRSCPRKDKAFCIKCKRKHHVSICKNSNSDLIPLTTANQVNIFASNVTLLQTAKVFITGPTGISKLTRRILDGGSQSSFVSTRLVDVLNLKVISTDNLDVRGFESHSSETQPRRRVQLELSSIWNKSSVSLSAFESSNTYAPHQTVPTDITLFARKKKLKLADPYEKTDNLPIEVLIGADFYWTVMTVKPPKKLTESLVLMSSIFGWFLRGSRSMTNIKFDKTYAFHNICTDKVTLQEEDEDVRPFWDLEALGIKASQEKEMSTLNREILKQFHDSYKNQVEIAPETTVNESRTFYLPHHVVKKHKNNNAKYGRVFDGSSHSPGHPSLNEVLEKWPNLLPEILATLLRFRLHKQAIICNGSQAFLQLTSSEEDRDATRLLWFRTEKDADGKTHLLNDILIYRFSRLPFGLRPSPFLLSASLPELVSKNFDTYPLAAKRLEGNIFMDDFVMGVCTEDEASALYSEVKNLMALISLTLAKWATNSQRLRGKCRNRLSPLKRITPPRLELMACLIGARLLNFICSNTSLDRNAATLWTDSTVALSWIRGDPNRWKIFVCNRTTEILHYTTPSQWRHCPGFQNPSDHISRGISPTEPSSLDIWWDGPDWLSQHPDNWPTESDSLKEIPQCTAEARKPKVQPLCTSTFQPVINASYFSSYTRLLRVTAWILRFLKNCKSKHRLFQELTSDEIEKAKDYWILVVQKQCFHVEIKALEKSMPLPAKSKIGCFNPFLQENHLRLGGRLQFAQVTSEEKHPLLLDGSHLLCNFSYATLTCVCITWVSGLFFQNYDRIIGFYVDVKL